MSVFSLKGSEWNKWDFHIHTPYSVLNNQFNIQADENNCITTDDFDEYFVRLIEKAIQTETRGIGITDYFSIDGYKHIKQEYLGNEEKLLSLFPDEEVRAQIGDLFFFPNIEFRLDSFVGRESHSINYHVVFSPELETEHIIEDFLNKLTFSLPSGELRCISKREVKECGAQLKREQQFTGNDYIVGLQHITVKIDDIVNILDANSNFRDKYILCVPSDEDLSNISWSGRDHITRKKFLIQSHCFFSSNKGTISWALGEKSANINEYLDEFKKLKPCIWGSDAHNYEKMFLPSEDRFCWIKADLSFEGLRQILFEPKQRVFIGSIKPEQKSGYHLIDYIAIENSDFTSDRIYFNDNLTTIIGGKSTGKSVLLFNTAFAIDKDQTILKVGNNTHLKPITKFEVKWKDGSTSNGTNENLKSIIYIPQSYLNRISDDQQIFSEIDNVIQNVLIQNDSINQSKINLDQQINTIKHRTTIQIAEFVSLLERNKKNWSELKEFGLPQGIQGTIEKLELEQSQLLSVTQISIQDVEEYQTSVKELSKINEAISKISQDRKILSNDNFIEIKMPNLGQIISDECDFIKSKVGEFNSEVKEQWKVKQSEILSRLDEVINSLSLLKSQHELVIERLQPIIEQSSRIKELGTQLQKQREYFQTSQTKYSLLMKAEEASREYIKNIACAISEYAQAYKSFIEFVNESTSSVISGLAFNATAVFKSFEYNEVVGDLLDKRQFSRFKKFDLGQIDNDIYNEENIRCLIENLISEDASTIGLKLNHNLSSALESIIGDYFMINYNVCLENDDIHNMSPGKKALVLLKLLIDLSDNKTPILLDQPEDDLDNRSIFYDLVEYIKKRKSDRQIIIVTHNANIVLGADSELVIVAHQKDISSDEQMHRIEYRSGSIENADTDIDGNSRGILYKKTIQKHICEIMEGGERAFELRRKKYSINVE